MLLVLIHVVDRYVEGVGVVSIRVRDVVPEIQSPGDTSSLMYHAVTPAVTVDVTVDVTRALCGQRFGQRVAVTLM